jgi:uncharacterized protein (TIGR02246 family)
MVSVHALVEALMRRARVVLASTLLVVSVSRATCQQTSEIRATAEAAIRAADAAGLKAAQAKDVVGATSNYADDAFWLPPHAPLVQGKEAIRSAWTQFLGTPGLKIDWQITKIDVSRAGDMAYALYKYQMTMSTPNGAPIDDRGKDMAVWVKQLDGKWKMVADSFNSDVPLLSGTSK